MPGGGGECPLENEIFQCVAVEATCEELIWIELIVAEGSHRLFPITTRLLSFKTSHYCANIEALIWNQPIVVECLKQLCSFKTRRFGAISQKL